MITGERYIAGFDQDDYAPVACATPGLKISHIPGTPGNISGAPGPQTISVTWGFSAVSDSENAIARGGFCPPPDIDGFPGSGPDYSYSWAMEGTHSTYLFTNLGDDKVFRTHDLFGIPFDLVFANGFWQTSLVSTLTTEDPNYNKWFYIQFTAYDLVVDFPGTPPASMRAPTKPVVSQTGGIGPFTIEWTSQSDTAAEEIGFVILRSFNGAAYVSVGSVPSDATIFPDYSYVDLPEENGDYTYKVQAYKYEPERTLAPESLASDEEEFDDEPEEEPDILIGFSTGGIVFSGRAKLVGDFQLIHTPTGGIDFGNSTGDNIDAMIMNPSGIYTLVEGKTHDTLYERMTGITSQNVKIPDPFVKTGFI